MSDLISRGALIKEFRKIHISFIGVLMEESDMMISYRSLARIINNQPTVEAKPVVYGEWIDTQPNYRPGCGNNAHKCSICGDYYTTEPEDLFFCPRCGADMRGGKND